MSEATSRQPSGMLPLFEPYPCSIAPSATSLHVDLFPLHHLPNLLSSALLATQTKTIICTIKGNPTSCRLIHVWVE